MQPADDGKQKKSLIPVLLAALVGLALIVAMVFLSAGIFAGVVVMAVGVFGIAGLHYIVWGWWLSKLIHEEQEAEAAEQRLKPPDAPTK